ncbi:MAG: hypothetical protein R8L53_06715 [Mariprofundales bacterium]
MEPISCWLVPKYLLTKLGVTGCAKAATVEAGKATAAKQLVIGV